MSLSTRAGAETRVYSPAEIKSGKFAFEWAKRWLQNGASDPNDHVRLQLSVMYQSEADFQELVGIKKDSVQKEFVNGGGYYFLTYKTEHKGISYQEYWIAANRFNPKSSRLYRYLVRYL